MGWFAVIIVITIIMGGLAYFDKPLFDNTLDTAKEGSATIWSWAKNKTKEQNITFDDIKDRIEYNTTEVNGRTYYGMPYLEIPCDNDEDCEWFERDLLCDVEKGECYK